LLAARRAFYPQFATHNAHTIAIITELAGDRMDYEFQRLHGMGEDLYGEVIDNEGFQSNCRVYAPVGNHEDLLPSLVRRLLENGANTSFVNRIVDESLPVSEVVRDPIECVKETEPVFHPSIPLPGGIYGDERRNSAGINLANESEARQLAEEMQKFARVKWRAGPLISGRTDDFHENRKTDPIINPSLISSNIGTVTMTSTEEVDRAIATATANADRWERTPASTRADNLETMADLLEQNPPELMALCSLEAGKTVHDALSEVREAVDFCRYYALQARKLFSSPQVMPGPTGERNELTLHGRGVFVCISPWNFPLAIFTGQIAAALAAGNAVLAKPAEQTPAIAYLAATLFHQAGVPSEILQLLPGDGSSVGAQLTADPRIDGVAFTGSTATAHIINRTLAARESSLATLIAETGGQNVMIVDSSALPEQVVLDVVGSAFLSAGQRCSALRVLYLQAEVADHVIRLLSGAMQELTIGDPRRMSTDIGPVIDEDALASLQAHVSWLDTNGTLISRVEIPAGLNGHFFSACAYEIDSISQLERENFGPVLHVIRYRSTELDHVIDQINATGYGLTMGVHSRINDTQEYVADRIRAGNRYVNRTMTGAVVGVQPFGGERLSGTGPKAGGPHYMLRFATERTLTINTAAVGGNASLLALE
jgi:RHH-type proline utilization regulon transcriptional repressor/proline dehydrogenase/delta 1-pyrroline-5-carboxylate dehydrogenase